jgi:serine palmitoyltransferase
MVAKDGAVKECLNLTAFDMLGLSTREKIHTATATALRKYGVGACGPPGFYGTIGTFLRVRNADPRRAC